MCRFFPEHSQGRWLYHSLGQPIARSDHLVMGWEELWKQWGALDLHTIYLFQTFGCHVAFVSIAPEINRKWEMGMRIHEIATLRTSSLTYQIILWEMLSICRLLSSPRKKKDLDVSRGSSETLNFFQDCSSPMTPSFCFPVPLLVEMPDTY